MSDPQLEQPRCTLFRLLSRGSWTYMYNFDSKHGFFISRSFWELGRYFLQTTERLSIDWLALWRRVVCRAARSHSVCCCWTLNQARLRLVVIISWHPITSSYLYTEIIEHLCQWLTAVSSLEPKLSTTNAARTPHCCNDDQQINKKTGVLTPCRFETPEDFITKIAHFDYVERCNMQLCMPIFMGIYFF